MNRTRLKTLAFWTTTTFGPTSFVIGGALALTQSPDVTAALHHLGYPAYFALMLGSWKLLGAIVITVPGLPRLKEWAYAGFVFDLTAAAYSHAMSGDGASDILAPLGFLALVLASWALRPASRALASHAPEPEPAVTVPVFAPSPVR
jgi:DoxX-like family